MLVPIQGKEDHFLDVQQPARQWAKEYKWRTEEPTSGETKPNKNTTETSINTEKKLKIKIQKGYNTDENTNEVQDKKSKHKRFAFTKEPLNEISEESNQKYKPQLPHAASAAVVPSRPRNAMQR
jgi:hypothetical protein